jgi:hypothetical protein
VCSSRSKENTITNAGYFLVVQVESPFLENENSSRDNSFVHLAILSTNEVCHMVNFHHYLVSFLRWQSCRHVFLEISIHGIVITKKVQAPSNFWIRLHYSFHLSPKSNKVNINRFDFTCSKKLINLPSVILPM